MEKFLVRGRKRPSDREFFEGYLKVGAFLLCIQNHNNGNKKRVFKDSIQRYSGKLDKFARKIFEGDIVRLKDKFAYVEFSEEHAKFQLVFWMENKVKDFEQVFSGDVIKVGNTLVNDSWLKHKGNLFVDFSLAFEYLEEQKRTVVDQTRLVIKTVGSNDHKEMAYRDVFVYDESKQKILAYITPDIFKILDARDLITKPVYENSFSSTHIYVGTLVKKRKNAKKTQEEVKKDEE